MTEPQTDRMAPARAARAAKRAATAQTAQAISPARATVGHNSGRAVALGRDGQPISRLGSTVNSDKFFVPQELVPQSWVYQWNVVEVLGQPQLNSQITAHRGGWRPVPADRHDGVWTPNGHKGDIVQDGLRLEERPKILDDEAKAEELAKARRQVSDQNEALQLSRKLPEGFSRDNSNLRRMERQGTSTTIAPAPDAPRPRLEIDQG